MGPKSILETSCDSFWSDFRSISDIWWVSVFHELFFEFRYRKIEERKRLFDQVMDWAEKYDTYSEEDQKKIAEFEKCLISSMMNRKKNQRGSHVHDWKEFR